MLGRNAKVDATAACQFLPDNQFATVEVKGNHITLNRRSNSEGAMKTHFRGLSVENTNFLQLVGQTIVLSNL